MPGRSTPSLERAPDGPLSLNGSIKSVDTLAAALLHDQPAEAGADGGSGKDYADTPAEGRDATLRTSPPADGEIEQVAEESSASRNGAPEPGQADEAGTPVGQADHDQPARATGPEESDEKDEPRARARTSTALHALLERRGLRPTVFGVALAVLAGALGVSSALSISLLIAGLLFLLVGLMGPRLQGRFAVEFGPDGASIEMQLDMAPPGPPGSLRLVHREGRPVR